MSLLELADLGVGFKRYFEVLPATTEDLQAHAFSIRHQVYCEELKYEPPHPDGRERDEHDAHSVHCLIRSVADGSYVGCTRLVLAKPSDPLYPLPIEKTCVHTIDRAILDPQRLPRHSIAEISRLAVIASYRNRRGEKESPAPLNEQAFGTAERPRFPYLIVGLYLATVELARQHDISTLLVLTESRLARQFARLGVHIRQIGGPVQHRGTRIPSVINAQEVLDGLNFVVRPLYSVVAEEITAGLRQQRATAATANPASTAP